MPAVTLVERVAPARVAAPSPPLLVLLHGIGADEHDLFPVAPLLDPRLRVVSLRAPHRYYQGFAWFPIDFLPGGRVVPHADEARRALAGLVGWLEDAPARHGTAAGRTFLLGFSQGAMMALGALRTVPERLAGVVALSGRSPGTLFEAQAAEAAIGRVPLLVAHGVYDDVLPVEHGRATRDAFAGVSRDFTYEEFPVAHGLADDEIALVARWLAARI